MFRQPLPCTNPAIPGRQKGTPSGTARESHSVPGGCIAQAKGPPPHRSYLNTPTLYLQTAQPLFEGQILRSGHITSRFLAFALAFLISDAALACKDNMAFKTDKQKHFASSVAISSTAFLISEDASIAFATGVAIGLAKEVADAHSYRGCSSVQDFAYDVLGSALGALGTNWVIRHDFIGYRASF